MTDDVLLRLRGVSKHFPLRRAGLWGESPLVRAVDDVALEVRAGEIFGIVGESGSGKTTLARLMARLLPVTSGTIEFDGTDITTMSGRALRQLRGEVQIVFQDPYSALNPRKRIGDIIGLPLRISGMAAPERRRQVARLMESVGLDSAYYNRFPHEFSGGQRQRVGIARALAPGPRLLICDEPVSALDVSIQAQITNLLVDLQSDLNLTCILIAHDLHLVRRVADRTAVMYLGNLVEVGDRSVYGAPLHPYTNALLSAAPIADPDVSRRRERVTLRGEIGSALNPPSGCRFHPRCPNGLEICSAQAPQLAATQSAAHLVACHNPIERTPAGP